VASFETIEHIADHPRFLAELKRVLAPGGVVVISSPDKAEYRRRSAAGNPFHEAELTHDEFLQLMKETFKHCIGGKQRLVVGSWMAPDAASAKVGAATFQGGFGGIESHPGVHHGVYSIAICSDKPLRR
jgi:SAM-dependent methyltransferase